MRKKYIVVKTEIFNIEEIKTSVECFQRISDAQDYIIVQKDLLMAEIIERYDPGNFANFELEEYGEIISSYNRLEFIDFKGEYQVIYELKICNCL